MASSSSDPTAAVLQALQTLYHDPDSANKKRANEWLEEFQHSIEAWQTCHVLLTSSESPLEGRLFSAQTLRAKIIYDLQQLPLEQLAPLRDSLLSPLRTLSSSGAPVGSKAVLTQLCLAIADLALQMPDWIDPPSDMIEQFGKDPSTVGVLLGFLKALIEESENGRVPVAEGENRTTVQLLSGAAEKVLQILTMYIQAAGITQQIQITVFETLRSWIASGEVPPSTLAQTPLFNALFTALPDDALFDSAVDALCDLIHETQETGDNVEVIQQIIPRVIALRPQMEEHKEDPGRIRGYCRIFCEAGECYKDLIVQHPTDLLPLVEAIAACAAYPDLDIVPITFSFWYNLATALGRQPTDASAKPFLEIYSNLQTSIVGHLHFPADDEEQTAQERDEFRLFRHRMGDTLKDCCHVLGATTCLQRSYELVMTALAKPSPTWQELEAPLFSMRSMGAEVDPDDDEVLPHIMDMLPKLPDHPRIRYAAILVISRYTQWIDRHPQNLAFQLQYISAGFEMTQEEVSAAAAQAMKFMCQDCNQHLVPFLPQLFTFISSVGDKLDQADMVEVCEAIGYVINSMPPDGAAQALQQFTGPLLAKVQVVANATTEPTKPDIQKAADALEQIDAYLGVIRTLNPVPESCFQTAAVVYTLLDALLARYAKLYYISERVGSVLRRGLQFFPTRAIEPIIQPLLERMVASFEETGYASYLWITGKTAAKFGESTRGSGGEAVAGLLARAFEGITTALSKILQNKVVLEIPDVMDDYAHCLMAFLTSVPHLVFSSPILHLAISHILAALACPAPETVLICLDTLALLSNRLTTAQFNPVLQPVFAQYGKATMTLVLGGVVQGFPEDGVEQVQDIVRATVTVAPAQVVEEWAGEALAAIPGYAVPAESRQAFLQDLHENLAYPNEERLKNALNNLVRAARRARERGRQSRKSLGAGM